MFLMHLSLYSFYFKIQWQALSTVKLLYLSYFSKYYYLCWFLKIYLSSYLVNQFIYFLFFFFIINILILIFKNFLLLFNYSCLHFLPIPPPHPTIYLFSMLKYINRALTGVAQWIECRPVNQRVTGLIPS